MRDLACRIPEGDAVMSLLKRAENCRRQAVELLSQDLPDSSELEECSEQAGGLDIHFPEVSVLKQVSTDICVLCCFAFSVVSVLT